MRSILMYDLTNPEIIKYLCSKYGFSFSKGMGQNFITDEDVPLTMARKASEDAEGIIEIGPGFGSLTAALAQAADKVVSIELDRRLEKVLAETLAGFDNVEFIWDDCMKVDMKKLIAEKFPSGNVSVAANLPYYITTPIIMSLIEGGLPLKRIVVMIQKEVAERLCAKPGGKEYGAVTVAAQYRCKTEIIKNVPASSFIPRPKVDSAVICLEMRDKPLVSPLNEKAFFALVKAAFAQRRKTLANALSAAGIFGSKESISAAISGMELSPTVRGEALSIGQFCALSDYFEKKQIK